MFTRKISISLAAAGAVLGSVASPAIAADTMDPNVEQRCTSEQHRDHGFLNVDTWVKLCVVRSGGTYWARADVRWSGVAGRDFEKYVVNVRLERNDADYRTKNDNLVGEWGDGSDSKLISTGGYTSATLGGWTADGNVTYNEDLDGKGDYVWHLTGSPSL
ncbi:hypothetical protein [Streptomyces longisporoflavus]|uniref:Secreted protein n=1 Tax=Streptomyces longisporoflavus TaxID=28044 RepID=A0ABW7R3H8_9ACTN